MFRYKLLLEPTVIAGLFHLDKQALSHIACPNARRLKLLYQLQSLFKVLVSKIVFVLIIKLFKPDFQISLFVDIIDYLLAGLFDFFVRVNQPPLLVEKIVKR
ncbi:MAG: hypothetical protein BWY69_01392 [Planctomycetes bacterium ADurb.Bin401]|nr:MAG: hypothetical protein BWY69_01392 [Planctomycetes bacterium ADurb.Bin401]